MVVLEVQLMIFRAIRVQGKFSVSVSRRANISHLIGFTDGYSIWALFSNLRDFLFISEKSGGTIFISL